MDVGLSPGDFVLDGDPVPPPKKGAEPPKFSAHVYCGQTAEWITWHKGRPQPRRLDGDPDPLPTKGVEPPPQFSAHFYCGQTVDASRSHLVWR